MQIVGQERPMVQFTWKEFDIAQIARYQLSVVQFTR